LSEAGFKSGGLINLVEEILRQHSIKLSIIPATQEAEVERLRSEADQCKSLRTYLKNKLEKQKNWEHGSSGRALA
jgi:hypothetical protein